MIDEIDVERFCSEFEAIEEKATLARDIWKDITKNKGCDDYFTIEHDYIKWVGSYNISCRCHGEWIENTFSRPLGELIEMDLEVYRDKLLGIEEKKPRIKL